MNERSKSLTRRARGMIAIAVVLVLVAGGVVGGYFLQLNGARQSYDNATARMAKAVEADASAQATLAAAKGGAFGASVTQLSSALSQCLGTASLTQTTADVAQLESFQAVATPARVLQPAIAAPSSASGYDSAARRIDVLLTADSLKTADTEADAQSDAIATNEVNLDLDAVGKSIGTTSRTIEARYVYATSGTKSAYATDVSQVAAAVSGIDQPQASNAPTDITSAQSAALVSALTGFASGCEAARTSSVANTPKHVVTCHLTAVRGSIAENFPGMPIYNYTNKRVCN